jgi:hypothetical protein
MQTKRASLSDSERPSASSRRTANRRRATKGLGATALGVFLAFGGGCAPSSLSALLQIEPVVETATLPSGPYETAAVVQGTPTAVYAQVARGILGCWFGADGPLNASHVFRAEARPPARGGAARIVIHERDPSLPDQRGSRAYRISFAGEAAGVRIGMSAVRFELARAEAMARDVEGWAKGNAGCRLRALSPQPLHAGEVGEAPSKKR